MDIFYKSVTLVISCFVFPLKCELQYPNMLLEYPYQSLVRLAAPRSDNTTQFNHRPCTGVIVNSVYILTYARCSETAGNKGPITVVSLANSIIDMEDNTTERTVRWIKHDSHYQFPKRYDLALVELNESIPYTHFIHPAVLFYGNMSMIEVNFQCAVIGWNDSLRRSDSFIYFSLLTKGDVKILNGTSCTQTFPKYEEVICAKVVEPVDLCEMDLGTPLACGVKNIWVFIGIYIGVNTCPDTDKGMFLFRKFEYMHDWLMQAANGVYFLNGNKLSNRSDVIRLSGNTNKSKCKNYIFILLVACIYLK